MFRINSNQSIKISKGDSVYFPLFLNKGTAKKPIRYSFIKESIESEIIAASLEAAITDLELWRAKATETATYTFTYNDSSWILTYINKDKEIIEVPVDPLEYGLEITGTPVNNDKIKIMYTKPDAGEVHFYVLHINMDPKHPVLEKIYKSNGEIISKRFKKREEIVTSSNNDTVNENGDMIITLEPEDTDYMYEGEYKYEIKAYLKNDAEEEYSINTVTNRLPFVVVNDNYASDFIYR